MTWREFIETNADTLGVTLFFAALGSAFMLRVRPVTPGKALTVFAAGQLAGNVATAVCFGYLGWSIFLAPLIGTLCGLVGLYILMTTIKAGARVEDRGSDVGDVLIEKLGKKKEG